MDEKQIIRKIMWNKRITQRELAEQLDCKNQSAVSAKLNGESIKVNTAVKLLRVLGYELVIRAKDGSEEYVVRGEGK